MDESMQVVWMKPGDLIPYQKNAKTHPPEQIERIKASIKNFRWTQPIVVDENNVVVIGHGRLQAAIELHQEKVPVVKRTDLTPVQIKKLRLADNKTNESDWDLSKLEEELAELAIEGEDMTIFGFDDLGDVGEIGENPYTGKVNIPQYEPTGEDVKLGDLVDESKTEELLDEIEKSGVSDEEKDFLRKAAQRHLAFNYKRVAEYYANASEEMQELMEKSALVIIDYDDAIAYGFTRLDASVKEMFDDVEG